MMRQIRNLTKLELCNLFGLNVFRHSKDKKAGNRTKLLMGAWMFVIAVVVCYVGGLSYGLVLLEAAEVIPAYLITISSLIMFFFGIFKAGSVIFSKGGYDILCSLPVSKAAIVISRYMRMYVENLLLALLIMVPGVVVYGWFIGPEVSFYLIGVLVILMMPLVPITVATIIGAGITAIASRMKHKSLVAAGLSVLLVLLILLGSSQLAGLKGNVTPEMLKEISGTVFMLLKKLCPPAVWMGNSMVNGDFLVCFGWMGVSLALFAVMAVLVSAGFHSICRGLYSSLAKHDYQMESLKRRSVLSALYKRELKRYFSSSVYVTNTIIGPILGMVLAVSLLFVDAEPFVQSLPINVDVVGLIPFLLAGVFTLMTTVSVSISMEGKEWWIVKSLPLATKIILDSKLLFNLSLMLPFWLIFEVALAVALRPGILELFWLIAVPAVIMMFACVYGITINLHFPVLNWESDVSVVKQSASAVLGGMGGFFVAIVGVAALLVVPEQFSDLLKAVICIVLLGATALLYRKNNAADLQEIG